uniref:glucuronosyltransferase n=1 Tax=Parastrongyloides trichosuri TaxID=131310 RepID=A0A0N4ZZG8_PARTI
MKFIFKTLLLFILYSSITHCYKILIYNPRRAHSHVQYVGLIADVLQEAGHNVTVLQPIQLGAIKTVGSKKAKVIVINPINENSEALKLLNKFEDQIWTKEGGNTFKMISVFQSMHELLKANCKQLISNITLMDELRNENFDLAFAQNYAPCGFGIFELLNIKNIVSGSSTGLNEAFFNLYGLEFPSSYIPSIMGSSGIPKGFIGRMKNVLSHLISKFAIISVLINKDQEAFDEVFGVGKINLKKSMQNVAFHFVNANPLLDFPHPTMSKIIDVAGIGMPVSKSLDREYNNILNLRPLNVLMSFGSIVKSKNIPPEVRESILKTFAKFPNATFIWKFEDDDISFAKDYPNVILKKWIPQVDLLNDKRIDLFITHGGLNSAIELSHKGVPAIFIPFFSDQKINSYMIERYGCNIVMDKEDLRDSDEFTRHIGEILNNKRYKFNAEKLARMLRKYPHDAKNRLINAVEFAAEFGHVKEMDLPSLNMNFIEHYNIDIMIVMISFILGLIFAFYKFGKWIVTKCIKKLDGKKKNE